MNSESSAPRGGVREGAAFHLRDATVEDAEAIEAVHWAARAAVYEGRVADWPPSGPDRAGRVERWKQWLGSPDVSCILAEDEGRITGFVTVRASKDPDAATDTAEMPTLYVDPPSWRRGLGSLLCRAAVERTASMGFRELTLWVVDVNRRAKAFYAAFGFEPDGATQVDEDTTERLVAHRYRLALPAPS